MQYEFSFIVCIPDIQILFVIFINLWLLTKHCILYKKSIFQLIKYFPMTNEFIHRKISNEMERINIWHIYIKKEF